MSKSVNDQPLPNRFEDYIATLHIGESEGLYPVSDETMSYLKEIGEYAGTSELFFKQLPFSFNFDGYSYDYIGISVKGYAVLLDSQRAVGQVDEQPIPTVVSSPYIDIFGSYFAYNTQLKQNFDGYKHTVLAPWFDIQLIACIRSTNHYAASNYITALNARGSTAASSKSDVLSGKYPYPPGINSSLGGVKQYVGSDSQGAVCVFRWHCFTFPAFANVIKFDLVLRENGTVEFRYAQPEGEVTAVAAGSAAESATIGIFANGRDYNNNAVSSARYRDFSQFFVKSPSDTRIKHVNGGVAWNGSYIDTSRNTLLTSPTNQAEFTVSLYVKDNWPASEVTGHGATIRFTPPKVRRRQRRSIVTIRDSVPFIRTNQDTSLFNDRKSIIFSGNSALQYPSMLPVSYKTEIDADNPDTLAVINMYQSGSIEVTRQLRPAMYESALYDSIIETSRKLR